MSLELDLPDAAATESLGRHLAASMPAAAVLGLRGELGAGKSTVARALLRALGVIGPIKSPTYTLVEQYSLPGGDALHLDLYRIAEPAELDFLGLADMGAGARCWLVEWPERAGNALPPGDLDLLLQVSGEGRSAKLAPRTATGRVWLEEFSKTAAPGRSV